MRHLDLRSLRFDVHGDAWLVAPVEVDEFQIGGQSYQVPDDVVDVDLSVGRVGDRLTLTAVIDTELRGPCQRCLAPATVAIHAEGVETALRGESEGDDADEVYVETYRLDLLAWVRDLVASALPLKLLCREDCRGLCPVCGADLNADPGHVHVY